MADRRLAAELASKNVGGVASASAELLSLERAAMCCDPPVGWPPRGALPRNAAERDFQYMASRRSERSN